MNTLLFIIKIFALLLEAIAEYGKDYRRKFYEKLDSFFTTINGQSLSGRYTEYPVIFARKKRLEGIDWNDETMGSDITTGEGALLVVALAALFQDPKIFAKEADSLLKSFISDNFTRNNSIVFGLVVQTLINGIPLKDMPSYIQKMASDPDIREYGGAFDNFLSPGYAARAVAIPELASFDPKYVGVLYGLDCQLTTHLAPAVYYLLHRIPSDFELAVGCACNGNNLLQKYSCTKLVRLNVFLHRWWEQCYARCSDRSHGRGTKWFK